MSPTRLAGLELTRVFLSLQALQPLPHGHFMIIFSECAEQTANRLRRADCCKRLCGTWRTLLSASRSLFLKPGTASDAWV